MILTRSQYTCVFYQVISNKERIDFMGYTDNYERNVYGTMSFWLRNDYDHGRFFDREISHHELELAKANENMLQQLANVFTKVEKKKADIGGLIIEAKHVTKEFHSLLTYTMDRALHCNVIISTPTSLLDHMIREAEESLNVFAVLESGKELSPADANMHTSLIWLRQMSDHLGFIRHYLDTTNYQIHEELLASIQKFNNFLLQAEAMNTMLRHPRNEITPVQANFDKTLITNLKELEMDWLGLDDLIKKCALLTTAPPDLLEHIAREAHHAWRNLEGNVLR